MQFDHVRARKAAPYDFCFIDGDHDYAGVKADWEDCGPLAKVVAFHDCAHAAHGVAQLWNEIKAQGIYRTEEKVLSDMGTGICFREDT